VKRLEKRARKLVCSNTAHSCDEIKKLVLSEIIGIVDYILADSVPKLSVPTRQMGARVVMGK
jgi:hypothetical protein